MAKTPTNLPANTPKSSVPAPAVPDYMKQYAGLGTENISMQDMEMPRIKLVQGIDSELMATHDGLKAGDFFHTLAEVSLGSALKVVPLYITKTYVLWAPRPPIDQGGILARADDGIHWTPSNATFEVKVDKRGTKAIWKTAPTVEESGLAEWGTYDPTDQNSQPAATLCYVIVVALPDYPEYSPVAIFLQRSAVGVARKLLGKINLSRAPICGLQYEMSSFVDNSPAGDFNNYRFTASGFVTDQEEFESYRQLHEQFKKSGVRVRDLEAEGDSTAGGTAAAEAPTDAKTGGSRY